MDARGDWFFDAIRRERLPVAIVLAVVVLAGVNWIQDPDQARRWIRTMLALPLVFLAMTLWYAWSRRSRGPTDDEAARQRYFHAALTLAVFALGIRQITLGSLEIWVRSGDRGADLEFERRILGLATAVTFVVLGNALPKILTPLSILPLPLAERVSRARRFVGRVWLTLGVAMTIGFVAVPLTLARAVARWSAVTGILTILGAIVWMNFGPERGEG